MEHLFLVAGGGLAVENALKAAMDWKVRKNLAKGIGTEDEPIGTRVMHLEKAFHGRTGYTITLTNTADPRKYMYYARFDWPRVSVPAAKFPLEGKNLEDTIALEKKSLAEIEAAFKSDPNGICAFIMEPIQGEGGDNHFRTEYFKAVRELCDKYDAILIYDEVQSGMGITGKMWAWQHHGIEPDIICFGKKAQVCGILVNNRVDEVENNCFRESSRINSTWGGNICDMVRSARILQIIEEDKVLDNVNKVAPVLHKGLLDMQKEFPEKVSNVRYAGLMAAFDLPSAEVRDKLRNRLYENRILVLASGEKGVRFRPSLVVKEDEIQEGLEGIRKALKEI